MKRINNDRLIKLGKWAFMLAFILPLAIWSCGETATEEGDADDQTEMEAEDPAEEEDMAPAQDTTDQMEADTTHMEGDHHEGGGEHPEHPEG